MGLTQATTVGITVVMITAGIMAGAITGIGMVGITVEWFVLNWDWVSARSLFHERFR
jgi:hypothetical protein